MNASDYRSYRDEQVVRIVLCFIGLFLFIYIGKNLLIIYAPLRAYGSKQKENFSLRKGESRRGKGGVRRGVGMW